MEPGITIALISSIGAILVSFVSGVFSLINNKRIDDLEEQIDELMEENGKHKKRIAGLVILIRDWWRGFHVNAKHMKEHGLEPKYVPTKPDKELVDVD